MAVRKFIITVSIFLFSCLVIILLTKNRHRDPGSTTARIKYVMSWGVVLFYDENNRLPLLESWKDELLPYIDLANLYDNNEHAKNVYRDQWGNYLLYEFEGESYSFYSNGPNGIDENGTGDDIKLDFNIVEEMNELKQIRKKIKKDSESTTNSS